jgi:hypothetical protein
MSSTLTDLERVFYCTALGLTPAQVANLSQNDLTTLYLAAQANNQGFVARDANGHIPYTAGWAEAQDFPLFRRATALGESFSRRLGGINAFTCQSGRQYFVGLILKKGDVVSTLVFNAVAASITPANWWYALSNASFAPVAQTADQTTTVMPIGETSLNLTSPYTCTADGIFYASIMQNATTPATIYAGGAGGALVPLILTPPTAFVDNTHTGLTTPASAPNPATVSAGAQPLYCWWK